MVSSGWFEALAAKQRCVSVFVLRLYFLGHVRTRRVYVVDLRNPKTAAHSRRKDLPKCSPIDSDLVRADVELRGAILSAFEVKRGAQQAHHRRLIYKVSVSV